MAFRSYNFSENIGQSSTRKHTTIAVFFTAVLMFMIMENTECRICTRMTLEKKVKPVKRVEQCTQSYNASCGWFSSEQCTFYEKVDCIKEENRTVTIYRIVKECCPGYHKIKDGKCVDSKKDDGKVFLGLSQGAQAGIVCGILLVACVVLLTALHYCERRRRQKRANQAAEQEAVTQQQLLPLQKVDTEPIST